MPLGGRSHSLTPTGPARGLHPCCVCRGVGLAVGGLRGGWGSSGLDVLVPKRPTTSPGACPVALPLPGLLPTSPAAKCPCGPSTHTQWGHCREETPRICLRWVPCPGGWQGAEEQPRTGSLHHPSLVHAIAFHRNFTEGETEARSWVSPGSRQNLPRPLPLSSALSPGTGISIPRPCALRGSQPCSFLTPPPAGRAPRGAPFGALRGRWGCAALPGGGCPRVVLYPGAGELRERRVGVLAAVLAAQLLQGLEAGRPAAQALLVRTKQK